MMELQKHIHDIHIHRGCRVEVKYQEKQLGMLIFLLTILAVSCCRLYSSNEVVKLKNGTFYVLNKGQGICSGILDFLGIIQVQIRFEHCTRLQFLLSVILYMQFKLHEGKSEAAKTLYQECLHTLSAYQTKSSYPDASICDLLIALCFNHSTAL